MTKHTVTELETLRAIEASAALLIETLPAGEDLDRAIDAYGAAVGARIRADRAVAYHEAHGHAVRAALARAGIA